MAKWSLKEAKQQPVTGSRHIIDAATVLKEKFDYIKKTDLQYNQELSELLGCNLYLKREDSQENGSFKCRGAAYNMSSTEAENVVCASAGNHAQGVAMAANALKKHATIFMPEGTPLVKREATQRFGGKYITIKLVGDTFDEACAAAVQFSQENNFAFVHPFDDLSTIYGQGTVGKEIFDQAGELNLTIDTVIASVGGGGLSAGIAEYMREANIDAQLIGTEPKEAPSMTMTLISGSDRHLKRMSKKVDGAAVANVGVNTSKMLFQNHVPMHTVTEDQTYYALKVLHDAGVTTELAGALPIATLLAMKESIQGKTIVAVISGKNIDQARLDDILENKAPAEFPVDPKPLSYDPNQKTHVTRHFMRQTFPGAYDEPVARL